MALAEQTPEQFDVQMAMLNALSAHVALLDNVGRIVAVNDAWRRFGAANVLQSDDFLVGQNYLDVCERASGACSNEARDVAQGIRRVLAGELPEFRLEYPCNSPYEDRWFLMMVTPLSGEPHAGAVVMHVDISGRKQDVSTIRRAEQLARESEQRLGFALSAADIGDWDMNLRTNVARRSLKHDQCFGYEQALPEWGYDTFLAHVHDDDRGRVNQCFQSAMSGEGDYDVEFRTIWPDATVHWLWAKGRFYFDGDSAPYRVAGIVVDVTTRKHAEAQLRRALDRLHNAQRLGEIGDWEWDVVSQEISWSPHLFTITGRDPAAGPPKDYAELEQLFDAPSRDVQQHHVTRALTSGEAQRYELTVVRPDGARIATEVYAVPEHDGAGQVSRLRGTLQDVSSRKRAEAVLAASEQRLDLATQSAGIGIWDWNIVDDTLAWDARMYELYGITDQHNVSASASWTAGVHPDDWQVVRDTYRDTGDRSDGYAMSFRIVWPTGEVRYLEAHAILQRGGNGEPIRLIGVNRDITARKREEAALKQLADIVASSDDAIIGKDLQSTVTSWNRGAEKVFGYTAAETIGTSILALIPDDREHEERSIVDRVTRGESVEHFETLRRTKSGRLIEVSVTASPIRDALGAIVGLSTVARDISERKKLERQFYRAQRMESIGTLAGGIAHDLNNALSPIILSLDLLRASFPDSESQELLNIVSASAGHGADMVRQVLSFARGVEGKRLEVDMRVLVRDIEKISRDTFLKHITISARTAADLLPVLGDRTQLQQVLVNLCVNARDAMPSGGQLTISAENVRIHATHEHHAAALKAGTYVCVRVEDSGEGMSADTVERIFDPFFTTKEVGKGTGLGLSTSLAIVESHGGAMRVYSERGRGTTFTVYLPAHGEYATIAPDAPAALPRGNGELILIVDDEPAVRLVSKQMLEAFGYRVLLAADGVAALTLFDARRHEIAVVLTDMMMPVMDGQALIRNLRARVPNVRIVGTSGLSLYDAQDDPSREGLREFLPKPFTADALLRMLHLVLTDTLVNGDG